ncbi:zinc finger protein 2-like [Ostrinia nubilalis]|uniref:zinc finger protein 2-like n=1 Tax=Ostrinia nubilalis TaxID=29057 RepID=UPI0030826611
MNVTYSKKGPIYDPGICRCCGALKKCRILNLEYEYLGQKETYSDIFVECFGLMLSHLDGETKDRLICATCVSRLREASSFRRQVLQCEEKMLQSWIHVHSEGASGPPMVKKEFKIEVIKKEIEDDDMDHCEDNHDNGNALSDNIKVETNSKKVVTRNDELAKQQLLNKILKMKEKLKKIHPDKKLPKPKLKPPVRDKFVDEDSLMFQNAVTIVENSYVCPFQTSYSTYFCVYCKATFTDPNQLRDHTSKHDPKTFKSVFSKRKATYIDIERIDCRHCETKILDMDSFKTHIKDVHGKVVNNIKEEILKFRLKSDTISCTECDKTFVFFHALKRHMAEHFGSFVCDACGAHYFDRRSLELHTRNSHKSDERYACHECGKLFKSKHTMFFHVSSVHKKEAAFQCSKCDAVLFSDKDRYKHMLDVHGEAKIFPCDICGKVYTIKKNLREHNRTVHLKIFKHKCGICDRGFAQPSRLNEHVMSIHRNEKSFHCDICGKSYPRLHYLKIHIQSHNSQGP